MKRILFLFSTSIFLIATSCKSQKVASDPQVTSEPTVYKGVTDQLCAAEMAFGSYGSGIDGVALDKVMQVIKTHQLEYTSKNIGREGETRICLPLNDLKGSKKASIIEALKKIAKEGQLVSVSIR